MREVVAGMGFFFAADIGPGEVGLGEESDEGADMTTSCSSWPVGA